MFRPTTARVRPLALAIALAAMAAMPAGCRAVPPPAPGIAVRAHAVDLELLSDGSVAVREVLAVRSSATTPVRVTRVIPFEGTDRLFDAEVRIDGQLVPADVASVEVPRDLRASWTVPPGADTDSQLLLSYRAASVVVRRVNRGLLRWRVLPLVPAYPVEASRVSLTLPAGADWLAAPTIGSAGWQMSVRPEGLSATRVGIGPDEDVVLAADFSVEGLGVVEPDWHFLQERAGELAPAWASSGVFVLLVVFGIIWMLRVQYPAADAVPPRRERLDSGPEPGVADGLPADVTPAMRLALAARGRVPSRAAWHAAARHLAAAGSGAAGAAAAIAAGSEAPAHARLVSDDLWLGARGGAVVVDRAPARATLQRFRAALEDDLVAAGWVSAERLMVARGLRTASLAVMGVGVLCAAAVPVVLAGYGAWPYVLPASIVAGGAMLLPVAARLPRLTVAGARAAARVAGVRYATLSNASDSPSGTDGN